MDHRTIGMTALLMLTGCTAGGTQSPATTGRVPAVSYTPAGLERVLGTDAAGLARLFGAPDAEMREGTARKLQFAGPICVLDAYLYPKDGTVPRVAWLDARQPDGSPIDRASCVAALTRRSEAK